MYKNQINWSFVSWLVWNVKKKWMCCCCLVASVVSDSVRPYELQPARLLCPWDSAGKNEYWSGLPCPPPGELPDPGIEPGSPALQADSLPSEPAFILTSLQILLLSSSFSFIKFSTPFFPNMLSMGHLELVTQLLKKSGFLQNNAHSSLVLCLKHDRKDFQFYF